MQQSTVKFFVTLLRGYIYCFNLMQGWEGREGRSGDTLYGDGDTLLLVESVQMTLDACFR